MEGITKKIITRDIYRGAFGSKEDLISFIDGLTQEQLDRMNIVYAQYENGSYDGDCFVLWEENGKFYEFNCSHCSCNGLTWNDDLDETTLESILMRKSHWIEDFKESIKWE